MVDRTSTQPQVDSAPRRAWLQTTLSWPTFNKLGVKCANPCSRVQGVDSELVTKPVFVGLDAASSESGDAWEGFLTGLGERGLACPLLVISDGAAGLIGALERTMGAALRQRCLVHRARNVLAKVPKNAQAQVKADYWAILDVPDTIEPGLHAVGYVQKRIDSFEKRWRDSYPAAVRCLLEDRDSLTVYLRFPREHWTRVRHSNFIVIWSSFEGVFDVRHGASGCRVLRSGRGYLQSSRRQSLRGNDASCTSHLTGLVA